MPLGYAQRVILFCVRIIIHVMCFVKGPKSPVIVKNGMYSLIIQTKTFLYKFVTGQKKKHFFSYRYTGNTGTTANTIFPKLLQAHAFLRNTFNGIKFYKFPTSKPTKKLCPNRL